MKKNVIFNSKQTNKQWNRPHILFMYPKSVKVRVGHVSLSRCRKYLLPVLQYCAIGSEPGPDFSQYLTFMSSVQQEPQKALPGKAKALSNEVCTIPIPYRLFTVHKATA